VGAGGAAIGVAVGSTGVGGVLLVPFLIYALALPASMAVGVALWSYLWSGLVAAVLYARRGSIPWRDAGWVSFAALPGAYLGARAVALIPAATLEGLIATLLILAGINALRVPASTGGTPRPLGSAVLLILGGLVGFGSALLGAGGALILVPLLVALRQPLLPAVGVGQAIQIPIAAVASLANLRTGQVDLGLGFALAAAMSLGILVGTPLAHALPQRALGRLLAATMAVAGAAMLLRAI
jgi:uncharacterized protein